VGSTDVSTAAQLRTAIAAHSPSDRVTISWTDATGGSHRAAVTPVRGPVA
jgi:hypothetical protein